MNRQLPVNILQILERWFDISITCVKWGNQVSNFIVLKAGVRQGGAFSPCLFAIFIDDIVIKFNNNNNNNNNVFYCNKETIRNYAMTLCSHFKVTIRTPKEASGRLV